MFLVSYVLGTLLFEMRGSDRGYTRWLCPFASNLDEWAPGYGVQALVGVAANQL